MCDKPLDCAGYSIPASEHSTITSWGEEHELDAYANILQNCPEGLVACVSDSYDIYNAVRNLWGGALREKVLRRHGTLIIRPDSGDAVTVLEELFKIVSEVFGYEVNRKGWKTTVPCVRFIQGDGVNFYTIQNITAQLTRRGWSQDIWSYGMGGALLQQVNRDTLKFALKCSATDRNGKWQNVYKNPKTDPSKASKGGRFNLVHNGKDFATVEVLEGESLPQSPAFGSNALETVLEDGVVLRDQTLAEVRAIATSYDTYDQVQ
jgi:nicotinamide phosphoribosyltransferase